MPPGAKLSMYAGEEGRIANESVAVERNRADNAADFTKECMVIMLQRIDAETNILVGRFRQRYFRRNMKPS